MTSAQATPKGVHTPTVGLALLMIAVGVGAYFATGRASATALIPAFIGTPVLLCGLLAVVARKAALTAAMVLGVLGFIGPLGRIVPTAIKGELSFGAALISQIIFMVLAIAVAVVAFRGRR